MMARVIVAAVTLLALFAGGHGGGRVEVDPLNGVDDSGVRDGNQDSQAATYNDVTAPGLWATFDTATVNTGASGFVGAAFDGRYIYLDPMPIT